jgi:hypothetical protein
MKLFFFLAAAVLGRGAILTTYNTAAAFVSFAGAVQTVTLEQTTVLVYQSTEWSWSPGGLVSAAGVWIDTTPAGPGQGVQMLVRFADNSEQIAGFWGGDCSNVVGFRGVSSSVPFQSLVLRTGGPSFCGIQETLTLSDPVFAVVGSDDPPAYAPEPGGAALGALGLAALAMLGKRKGVL